MFEMLTYRITTKFHEIDNFHPAPHSGIDYACPVGTQAQSISDGVVSKIANDPMLGENVRVTASGSREWVYGHLSQVNVSTGQHVSSGDVLGLTGGVPGTPGAGHSTGAHLHLTLLHNGTPVDPSVMIGTASSDGGGGWLSSLGKLFTAPGTDLAGLPHPLSFGEVIFNGIGNGLTTLIHIMPEVCGLFAMVFLLIGMVGCKRAMRYAGTSVLLSFVGVMLNAAIS